MARLIDTAPLVDDPVEIDDSQGEGLRPGLTDEGDGDDVAGASEVRIAVERLTEAEVIRLERYARWRARGVGGSWPGREPEDLLREALVLTLSGERRWRPSRTSFFSHLAGVMRSLSSHWTSRERGTERTVDTDGGEHDVWTSVRSPTPPPDAIISAREQVKRIELLFMDDAEVTGILAGLRKGMSGPEIQASTGLSPVEYETALRRMRRRLARLEEREA